MDVRCDRCQTEYELDEGRLTEAGVAVKCTNCGNVFKVRLRSNPPAGSPPALGSPARVWQVRRYDGTTVTLNDLVELQRAVVERQVAPDDQVSISGGAWHTLGSIPELASFFEVVRASRSRTGSMLAAGSGSPGTGRTLTPVWEQGPSAIGRTAAAGADPAWTSGVDANPELDAMLESEDRRVLRKGGAGRWIGLGIGAVLVAGVVAVYAIGVPGMNAPGTLPVAPIKPPDVNVRPAPRSEGAPGPAQPPAAPAAAPEKTQALPAAPATPPATEAKGALEKPAAKPEPPTAAVSRKPAPSEEPGEASVPSGRNFDYYIGQGHKLLDSKPATALGMFEKAAELDPKSPEPDSGRGLAFANMEKLSDASSAFQVALKKSSEFTEAILGLAEVSARQGNRRKAMGLYQRYLDLAPDGPDAPAARAQLEQLKAEAPPEKVAAPSPAAAAPAVAPPKPAAPAAAAEVQPAELPPPPVVVPDTAPRAQ